MKEYTGICAYCGQARLVEIPEGMDPEDEARAAGMEATKLCNCMAGKEYRKRSEVLDLADSHIEQIFRADHPDIADIFQNMKELIYDGRVKKLSIREGTGGKAEMKQTRSGISVSFERTNKTELNT